MVMRNRKMETSTKTKIIALITGVIVMVLTDFISGRITNSFYALPFSVFLGALVAGYIVVKRAWLVGIVLAVVNSVISLVIYIVLGSGEVSLFQAMLHPVLFYLAAGFIGGLLGGLIRVRFNGHSANASA
jgi:putative membrane protein (TIGR04086 family)